LEDLIAEDLGEDSKTFDFLLEKGISKSKALDLLVVCPYIGVINQGTSAPRLCRCSRYFPFFFGLFLVQKKGKMVALGGVVNVFNFNHGEKNFSLLTDFMIDYFSLVR